MSELTYFKALSAMLYLIVALFMYRRVSEWMAKNEDNFMEEISDDNGLELHEVSAIAKTVVFVLCLFWPISILASKMRSWKK